MKFASSTIAPLLRRGSRGKMPRESSILADICCDFCFSRGGTPFTRSLTAAGNERNKDEGTGELLMKTQEASRRKTRPSLEELAVVAYAFSPSLLTKYVSFHYSLMPRPLLWPLYWCILGGWISLSLPFDVVNSLHRRRRQWLRSRNEISPFRSLYVRKILPFSFGLLAFRPKATISVGESLHVSFHR